MARLVEILDGAGIDSSRIESWIDESRKFMSWYLVATPNLSLFGYVKRFSEMDPIAIEKACLKIEPKEKVERPFFQRNAFGKLEDID